MEINGIKIRDMKDAQDVLTALETIKLGLENLSDNMEKNYSDYSSLNKNIDSSVNTQKEIISSISSMQIKSVDLLKNIDTLSNNIESANTSVLKELETKIQDIKYTLKKAVGSVINDMDMSVFTEQVNKLFDRQINTLNIEVLRLKDTSDNLDKINDATRATNKQINTLVKDTQAQIFENVHALNSTINKTLNNTQEQINSSINKINKVSRGLTWWKAAAVFVVGAAIGAGVMLGFGLKEAKPFYYSDLIKAEKQLQATKTALQQRYQNYTGIKKFLAKNHIDINFGYFNSTHIPYVYFKTDQFNGFVKNVDKNQYKVFGFKKNLQD